MPANLLDEPELGTESGEAQYHCTLNFGPQHPATHTTLRLVLELDGDRIIRATPHIGYLHSLFEKLGEHLNFNQYVTIAVFHGIIAVAPLKPDDRRSSLSSAWGIETLAFRRRL